MHFCQYLFICVGFLSSEYINMEADNLEDRKVDNFDMSLSWKKIERDNTKTGFREGISDGREYNFQKSFDFGYRKGFENGFTLGRCKGVLKVADLQHGTLTNEELSNSRKGLCCLCENNSPLEKSIEEINLLQKQRLEEFIEVFNKKHGISPSIQFVNNENTI